MRAPRKVVLVPSLPRNAAGKVLRRDLAAMAQGMIQGMARGMAQGMG
jgi:acyl-coenzyme A synthetase/AMP-(fatty) acid ligase